MSPRARAARATRRGVLRSAGLGALAVSLAGCSSEDGGSTSPTPTEGTEPATDGTPRGPATGGTYRLGLVQAPKGLNPLSTSSAYSWAILNLVYAGGTALEPVGFTVNPNAYTKWRVEDVDSESPKVFFTVREGLTWNDGEPFDVDDVLFTYEYIMDQRPGRYASTVSPIAAVDEADTEDDVVLTLKEPIGTYEVNQLQLPLLPEHVWSDVDDFRRYQPGEHVPDRPVGLGPGIVTTYEPDTAIEVAFRDPAEYQLSSLDWVRTHDVLTAGGPFIDRVRFTVYSSTTAMHEDYFRGELDGFYGSIRPSRVQDARDADGKALVPGTDTGYFYFGFNTRRVPFDDAAFRQIFGFLWDDVHWTRRLNRGLQIRGDYVIPPGYRAVRPEAEADVERLTHPATEVFDYRQSSPGVPDLEAVRAFLTSGSIVTGEPATVLGREYPGSLTGVTASQDAARHEYSFGPVSSPVLREHGADRELRVNGRTLTEIHGRPLDYLMYPPELVPEVTEMDREYIATLRDFGIPVERTVRELNTLLDRVFVREEFDIYHLAWGNTSPFGVSSLYSTFHSDNADDHAVVEDGTEAANSQLSLNNAVAYEGADDLIEAARTEMDPGERNRLVRRAVERIYLDFPYMVVSYDKLLWPVNARDFEGFIGDIPGPGDAWLDTQLLNIRRTDGS